MLKQAQPMEDEQPRRLSFYERWLRTQKLMWAFWVDEASLIYRRSAHGKARAKVLWVEFFLFVRQVLREFYQVQGTARAASLAYTTLLSLIPLVAALSEVLSRVFPRLFPGIQARFDDFLNLVFPYQASTIAYHINRFAEGAAAASAFGIIVFLFIAFRLFMAVEATINQIWKAETWRGYRQKLRAFTMLFFWGPLLIVLSFTTSEWIQRNESLNFLVGNPITERFVAIAFLFVAFTMLFWLVPATRVHLRSAAVGALMTAVLFEVVRWGFGVYAENLFAGRLNVIYGTLGLLIIFLVVLELMWVLILLGVEISYVYQNFEGFLRATEQKIEENPRFDLYFAMRAMIEVTRRFEAREEAPSHYRLAEEFGATDAQMLGVLRRLEDAQLVKEIGGDWTGFVPGGDPDRIAVEEVVKVMEGGYRELPTQTLSDPAGQVVARLFNTLTDCTSNALQTWTVGRLARELYGQKFPSRTTDAV